MPLWSALTPLGKQIVLGVLAVILLPAALLTRPWQVDVSPPHQADSGDHLISSARSEARLDPSPATGAPSVPAQPVIALTTVAPASEYAWAQAMETPKILGNLMRSPAPPDGAQAGAVVASNLSPAAASPPSSAALVVAAALREPIDREAAPQAVLVAVTADSPVATLVGAAFKAPEPAREPSSSAALVVTVISRTG